MKIHLLKGRADRGWTAFGGYWAQGTVRTDVFAVRNEQGEQIPVQSDITARWPDGSVKWSRHVVLSETLGNGGEVKAVRGTKNKNKSSKTPAAGQDREQAGKQPEAGGLSVAEEATEWRISGEQPEAGSLSVTEEEAGWRISGKRIRMLIPKEENLLVRDAELDGTAMFQAAFPVLFIGHESSTESGTIRETVGCPAEILERTIEERGPLQVTIRFDGVHTEDGEAKMPFRIRMSVHDDGEISFAHTFFFRGNPERDRLAGWGLRFETALSGTSWQRRIRMMTDRGIDRDAPTQLFYWRKHLDPGLLAGQMDGTIIPETEELNALAEDLPRWDRFLLLQDSASRCVVRKKAWEQGCWVDGLQGERSPGGMAINDPERSLSFHMRDFWEKHPSAMECEGLSGEKTACTAWFYAPQAEMFDFRHYDRRSYPMGTYEGFDYSRPDPNGIAVTRELKVFMSGKAPDEETLRAENRSARKPAVYTARPSYYHDRRAFGIWSLPRRGTETGKWIEKQINQACAFYRREIENRGWYGLFNYGDLMHTYEASRHMWRYDVGGYAWDNTELAPTYWFWLQFLRTGREDVFSMAEALSRHAADVDMYHFGEMKGLGSRHNVRHWGCPCKEPRVSMAGHHRPLYYLTGDRRIGDCMEDTLAAASSLGAMPWYTRSGKGITLRSGPDWAALVSDWMTAWERTLDPEWKEKIETGIRDLAGTPLGLTSGPEFGFDPESGHLLYQGEATEPTSMHLQACMGETEVWLETAEALPAPELADMTARNGRYFYLSPEERMAESGGLLAGRTFQSPIYSAEMQAYAARMAGDRDMAGEIWRRLLSLLYSKEKPEGFRTVSYGERDDGKPLEEIPWITTNFTAQWCLKAIVCLELIGDAMPETLRDLEKALEARPAEYGLYGA